MLESFGFIYFQLQLYTDTPLFKYVSFPMLTGSLVRKTAHICLGVGSPCRHSSINAEHCIVFYLCKNQFRIWGLSFNFWQCPVKHMKFYKFTSIISGKFKYLESVLEKKKYISQLLVHKHYHLIFYKM